MKKIIFLVTIAVIALGAKAQDVFFEYDGLYYRISGVRVFVASPRNMPGNVGLSGETHYSGSITVPETVEYKGEKYPVIGVFINAFDGCTELESLTLPETVTLIYESSLSNCGEIELNLPGNITTIYGLAFENTIVTNTSELNLPNCEYLAPRSLRGSSFKRLSIGPNITMMHGQAVYNSNIEMIEFLNGNADVRTGFSVHAFLGFKGHEIRLPNRTLLFAFESFRDCPNLERVYFPPVEKLVHSGDFQGLDEREGRYSEVNDMIYKCPNMKEVVCFANIPPQFYRHESLYTAFKIIDNEDCVLKVPAGSENLYRLDPVWGHFKTIEGFEPGEYTGVYEVAAVEAPYEQPVYYNLQGQRIDHPQPGYLYIRKQGSQVKKMVY